MKRELVKTARCYADTHQAFLWAHIMRQLADVLEKELDKNAENSLAD